MLKHEVLGLGSKIMFFATILVCLPFAYELFTINSFYYIKETTTLILPFLCTSIALYVLSLKFKPKKPAWRQRLSRRR